MCCCCCRFCRWIINELRFSFVRIASSIKHQNFRYYLYRDKIEQNFLFNAIQFLFYIWQTTKKEKNDTFVKNLICVNNVLGLDSFLLVVLLFHSVTLFVHIFFFFVFTWKIMWNAKHASAGNVCHLSLYLKKIFRIGIVLRLLYIVCSACVQLKCFMIVFAAILFFFFILLYFSVHNIICLQTHF